MSPDQVLHTYVGAFVDELSLAGVRHVCICPGSRSTPLATVFEQHPHLRVWMHLDERSGSFFALGLARALREPVALLCTSGTAAANFYPAVVEAHYGRVPLIVLTADRPPELREVGAAQTIDQLHLYGEHVKWFAEMALPEEAERVVRYVRGTADRAVATARATPPGPVHLNFPFREPLLPAPFEREQMGHRATVRTVTAQPTCPHEILEALARDLEPAKRGIIVCGSLDAPGFAQSVHRLGELLGYPILADPLSGARCGSPPRNVVSSYDAFLRDVAETDGLAPEVVLRFGGLPTSKPLTLFLQRHPCRHIVVDPAGWNDPMLLATDLIAADPTWFCRTVAPLCDGREHSTWLDRWLDLDAATRDAMARQMAAVDEPFEGKVFAELAEILPDGATLFAGSSMPVRDLDTFFHASDRNIRFMANRGANGIDGVVSTALGASVAARPLVLVLGDLSFYHDMNGLMAARLHDLDATIVVLNNDGGGIFSFLPQAGTPHFESLFGTPHGLQFGAAADLYGAGYRLVQTWADFREAVESGIRDRGLSIVEVPTDRERNVTLHREVWSAVSAALQELRSAPA